MSGTDAAELVLRHERLCWRLTRAVVPAWQSDDVREDVAAEVRLALFELARGYDPGRGASFLTYAWRAARGRAARAYSDHLRRGIYLPEYLDRRGNEDRSPRVRSLVAADREIPARPADPPRQYPPDFWPRVRRNLTPAQWEFVDAVFRRGVGRTDAGAARGVTRDTAYNAVKAARKRLRKRLPGLVEYL